MYTGEKERERERERVWKYLMNVLENYIRLM